MPGSPLPAAALAARARAARGKPAPSAAQQRAARATVTKVTDAVGRVTGNKRVDLAPGVTDHLDVKALQRQLVRAGYKIPVDGVLDSTTKAALGDFLQPSKSHPLGNALSAALGKTTITGNRNPARFNSLLNPKTKSVVSTVKVDQNGNDPGGAPPAAQTDGGAGQTLDFSSLGNGLIGRLIPESLALGGGKSLDPDYADQIAGLQFDPQILDFVNQAKAQPRQAAQNIHDINHWYGIAEDSQHTAGLRDAAISKAAVGSMRDATGAILSSLGGGSNPGAGTVGAAGAEAVGTLGALGSIQDQYNSDLAPILQSEQAGQVARENARQSQMAAQIAQELAAARGQRGQAKGAAQMDILKYNNSQNDNYFNRLMSVKQYNNQVGQQNFGNQRSIIEDQIAAALNGIKAKTALATAAAKAASTGGPHKVDVSKIIAAAANLLHTDQNGRVPHGTNPQTIAAAVAAGLMAQGLQKGTPQYQSLGQQVYAGLRDYGGNPLVPGNGWFG